MNLIEHKMSSNSTTQQAKAEPRWQGISSFILGVISALPAASILTIILINYFRILLDVGPTWQRIVDCIAIFGLMWLGFGGWLFPAVSFVLGIMGLKYTKKKLAITGIILSIVGFVAYTFLYFAWSRRF
ncbi:hypothetical protein ACFLTN_02810 [Chloroflexota bacterium]